MQDSIKLSLENIVKYREEEGQFFHEHRLKKSLPPGAGLERLNSSYASLKVKTSWTIPAFTESARKLKKLFQLLEITELSTSGSEELAEHKEGRCLLSWIWD